MNFLDVIIVGITPVHGTGAVVQCQTVGPQHVGGDEYAAVGSIHPGFLYPPYAVIDLILFPVCPVHPATIHTNTHNYCTNKLTQEEGIALVQAGSVSRADE